MCSLHLTHPSGAVGSRHCGARGAVGGLWTLPATTLGYLGFQVQRSIH